MRCVARFPLSISFAAVAAFAMPALAAGSTRATLAIPAAIAPVLIAGGLFTLVRRRSKGKDPGHCGQHRAIGERTGPRGFLELLSDDAEA